MDRKTYDIGLFGKERLVCEGEDIYYYTTYHNEDVMLICDKNEKIMKMKVRKKNEQEYTEFDDGKIEKEVRRLLDDDGSRWEGDLLNEQPLGFGSLYDGEGNRTYSGFMFDGKKIAFGEEYFADNQKVDYCGTFMNGLRHGWVTTYDRNGQKLY